MNLQLHQKISSSHTELLSFFCVCGVLKLDPSLAPTIDALIESGRMKYDDDDDVGGGGGDDGDDGGDGGGLSDSLSYSYSFSFAVLCMHEARRGEADEAGEALTHVWLMVNFKIGRDKRVLI